MENRNAFQKATAENNVMRTIIYYANIMTNNQLVSSPYSKVFTAFPLKINEFKLWNMILIKKK